MSLRNPVIFETTFTQYIGTDIMGEGGTGRVFLATDDAGNVYAIKLLDPAKANSEKLKRFKNEITFSLRNQHPNIITVTDHGVFIDGKKHSPFYVMPLYQGSLRTLLKTGIPPERVLYYFSQLLDGMEAAHLQRVIHRDLKPENVLYDKTQDRLLIADFGIAHFEVEDLYTDAKTSPNDKLANMEYAAPEQRRRGLQVDHRADIFALGLLLNEMFTGLVLSGTRHKTISDVAPDYVYLDDLVTEMSDQSVERRTNSIAEIKRQLIGRGDEFARFQRLNELKQTVVPVTDIDDPLINDPPILRDANYIRGVLFLDLSRPVNDKWIRALCNMGTFTSVMGKGPERFDIVGDRAAIRADEDDLKRIVNHFKDWLPIANRLYAQMIRNEKQEEEERQRRELQKEVEELERQKRVRASLRI